MHICALQRSEELDWFQGDASVHDAAALVRKASGEVTRLGKGGAPQRRRVHPLPQRALVP